MGAPLPIPTPCPRCQRDSRPYCRPILSPYCLRLSRGRGAGPACSPSSPHKYLCAPASYLSPSLELLGRFWKGPAWGLEGGGSWSLAGSEAEFIVRSDRQSELGFRPPRLPGETFCWSSGSRAFLRVTRGAHGGGGSGGGVQACIRVCQSGRGCKALAPRGLLCASKGPLWFLRTARP